MSQLTAKRMTKHWYESGFALIEMIGVIAIMAVLAGAMAPFLLNQLDNSEADAEQLALDAIAEGIRAYYLDENAGTYGTLPITTVWTAADATDDDSNWPEQLVPRYARGNIADIAINQRDVARLYAVNYPDFTAAPRVTLLSHLLVGGDEPTNVAAVCVGNAQAAVDPCGDSPGTTDDDMPDGIATGLIKVVNFNLAKERTMIIERVKKRFLTPAAAFFESLPNDVCQGIPDRDFAPANVYDLETVLGLAGVNGIVAPGPPAVGVVELTDFWGQAIKVSKFDSRIIVWSDGPLGVGVTPGDSPANPLYITATCQPGSDVNKQLNDIAETVMAFMVAQSTAPIEPPATLADAGVTILTDPWGANFNYSNAGAGIPPSFTLSSNGPTGSVIDDIDRSKSIEEIQAFFGKLGQSYPDPGEVNAVTCNAAESFITGNCDTALGYLTNASSCNTNITLDQKCAAAGR